MCGICGFIGKGNMGDLNRMNAALIHRGPDAEGTWHDSTRGVYLGHRRLSIIDLIGGAQPMWSGDGGLQRGEQQVNALGLLPVHLP